MNYGLYLSTQGAQAQSKWQDVIANNLALTLTAQGDLNEARTQVDKAVELTTRYSDRVESNRDLIQALEPAAQ